MTADTVNNRTTANLSNSVKHGKLQTLQVKAPKSTAKVKPLASFIDPSNLQTIDVPDKGDCFYHSLALSLLCYADHALLPEALNAFTNSAFGTTLNTLYQKNSGDITNLRDTLASGLKSYALQFYKEHQQAMNEEFIGIIELYREKAGDDNVLFKTMLNSVFNQVDAEKIVDSKNREETLSTIVAKALTTTDPEGPPAICFRLFEHALGIDIQNWVQNNNGWRHENLSKAMLGETHVQPQNGAPVVAHLHRVQSNVNASHFHMVAPDIAIGQRLLAAFSPQASQENQTLLTQEQASTTTPLFQQPAETRERPANSEVTQTRIENAPITKEKEIAAPNQKPALPESVINTDVIQEENTKSAPLTSKAAELKQEPEPLKPVVNTKAIQEENTENAPLTSEIAAPKQTLERPEPAISTDAIQESTPPTVETVEALTPKNKEAAIQNIADYVEKQGGHLQADTIKSNLNFFKTNLSAQIVPKQPGDNQPETDEEMAIRLQLEEIEAYERTYRGPGK